MSDENGNRDNVVGEEGKLASSFEVVAISMVQQDLEDASQGGKEVAPKKLARIIKKCKLSDDPHVLKDCVAALKLVLAQKKESPQVREFLASDDFPGFLKKCLTAKSDE